VKITVPAGESLELRTSGHKSVLENDAQLPGCTVLEDETNRLLIRGPRTVTGGPSMYGCREDGDRSS
jgi:hypothetical protein